MVPARFTDRARLAINYAHEEARKLNHSQVDTEHLLLGLIREGQSLAAYVLQELGVRPDRLEMVVRKRVKKSPTNNGRKQLFFTRAANQVLQLSLQEARRQEYDHVGTEHILLGLIREKNGIAAKVLASFNVTLEKARRALTPGVYLQSSAEVPSIRAFRPVDDRLDIEILLKSELQKYGIDPYVAKLLLKQIVQRLKMIPLKIENNILQVAATEPLNLLGIDEIKLITGLKVKPIIVPTQELQRAIDEQFSAETSQSDGK